MHCVLRSLGGAVALALALPAPAQGADVTCYVDGVAGDDTKDGLSEATAVKSRSKIPATCSIVKFKRGSVFDIPYGEQIVTMAYTSKINTLTNYGDASQPLPRFVKTRAPNSGGMLQVYQGNFTVDGLYLAGSQSDADMANLAKGIGIMIGGNSKILNSEITNCDIGIMTTGDNVLVQNNYIHDLHISVDAAQGVDPNVVGGAEGIFVNSSDVEVAYNTFVNCSETAQWTGNKCDGGATEVTVTNGGTVKNVHIHHNFSYNSCGFFEVSTTFMQGSGTFVKGLFSDSSFHDNVMIDSAWISLLQVNNTDLSNIRWENNTIVHHKDSINAGIMAIVFTDTSSGTSGGDLQPDTVFWTNNLWVFDGVFQLPPHKNFVQANNLIIDTSLQDPGLVKLAGTTNPADFDLTSTSPAINAGTLLAGRTTDFLGRTTPDSSGKMDVGAFEYGSSTATGAGGRPGTGGATGSGGQTVSGSGGNSGTAGSRTREGESGCSCQAASGSAGSTVALAVVALLSACRRRREAQNQVRASYSR